ncbi:MAG: ABC transporter ATP-binding protein [Bacillota bacterium]
MIEIENLTKIYKNGDISVKALKEVSFKIDKGEMLSIMGPSGSGKSTLMNLLGFLDTPSSGNYFLRGNDVSDLNENELADLRNNYVGFVFQQFNLLPKTTVVHNVELPLIYAGYSKKERKKIAEEMLENVGLGHRLKHYPNEISGGQKQRVAIARALANSPDLILADEPTGNLDTKTGENIMEIFHKLNDQGHTIVLVTHEEKIAKHANRKISLIDGEIREDEVFA